jgi:hypothetical protein
MARRTEPLLDDDHPDYGQPEVGRWPHDEHRYNLDTDRCGSGGLVVYFEDGDADGERGEGCEVSSRVWAERCNAYDDIHPVRDWRHPWICLVSVSVGAVVGLVTAGLFGAMTVLPNCPTEDSCTADYRDGRWVVEEIDADLDLGNVYQSLKDSYRDLARWVVEEIAP